MTPQEEAQLVVVDGPEPALGRLGELIHKYVPMAEEPDRALAALAARIERLEAVAEAARDPSPDGSFYRSLERFLAHPVDEAAEQAYRILVGVRAALAALRADKTTDPPDRNATEIWPSV